ncbi:undecaprenyl-diphosphate phosphatase [Thalassococcus sp. S3]|uniref:undecaprenyl-diphosphate phosphatase n=1 Tax=Thalassococcus sp. S3 TaxID=2017482 RepID=UPI0010240E6D|nr:undecaprenyl-diphosphate phosphatase [Thalassococcus sp. S3]QBF34063.1 undecaprenyl-diphosphatase [Thalassococcus sp. S3]
MTLFHLILVALIQGVTEFLPISSSGHLILLPGLTGLEDQGQFIDVAVHVGTLFAVIFYFWPDVRVALSGTLRLMRGKVDTQGAFLALCLAIATVPVVIVGLIIHLADLGAALRSIAVVGWATLIFGLVLYWADRTGAEARRAEQWTLRHALIMGLWQAVALIPGSSRSGVTITGARYLGYAREDAARLAMLMSIPTILASGTVLALDTAFAADLAAARDGAIAAVFAFVAALLALALMMRLLRSVSFAPYVVYRVILGIVLLAIAYT